MTASTIQRACVCLLTLYLAAAASVADDGAEPAAFPPLHSGGHSAIDADAAALDLALWSAAAEGDVELFDRLLTRGARVQASGLPTTALWIASQQGAVGIVERLLALDADLEAPDPADGRTALFQAAQEGHAAVVRLLLLSGARVDVVSARTGATPLFVAAARGHTDVVRELLAAQADVNALANVDGVVDTPLSIAVKRGFVEIAELIRRSGGVDRDSRQLPSGRKN